MIQSIKRLSDIRWAVWVAKSYLGTPYIWGGDDPIIGVDCSGLVINILRSVGRMPYIGDWTASDISKVFPVIDKPQRGALVFFGTPTRITHTGFCLDRYKMIEAGGGNRLSNSRSAAAEKNAYVRIRPVASRSDLVLVSDPFARKGYR